MTFWATVLAAVTIAFPKEGQRLPAVSRCYLIGATDGPETAIAVRGKRVPVHTTGAWGTLVAVRPGRNVVQVGDCCRTFFVAAPPVSAAKTNAAPAKVYRKLEYASDVAKPHPAGKPASSITVVVDAGHGGGDSGAVSPHGLPEKDANLRLAKDVARALEARGFRVVMTRDDDTFPALYDRPKVAHREKADAFVSIHHNAPAADRDPTRIRYQAVYAWNPLGERLAKALARQMASARPDLPSQGVLHANFAVTRNPEIPSCLVEADFVTSPEGEAAIWDPNRRTMTAAAIADGLVDWVSGL